MNDEVEWATVASVLDLADVLELVIDRFDDGALAQQELIAEIHEDIAHILAQLGDELDALCDEQVFDERLRNIAFVADEFAKEATDQGGNWLAIIDIARGQTDGQEFAPIIDDQVQFEAVEPADRGLATPRIDLEDPVGMDTSVVADGEWRRVNEADPRTRPILGMQIGHQRHDDARQQFDQAWIAEQVGKLGVQIDTDMLGIERFEGAVARYLKQDQHRHDLTRMESCRPLALSPIRQLFLLPYRLELLPKRIHRTIQRLQVEYTHDNASNRGLTGRCKPHHIPVEGILLIPNSILLAN